MRKLMMGLLFVTNFFCSMTYANFYFATGMGVTMGSMNSQLTYPTDQAVPTKATYDYSLLVFTPQLAVGYQKQFNYHWGMDTILSAEFNAGDTITKVNNWYPYPPTNAYTVISLPFVYAFDALATYRLNAAVSSFFGPGIALGQFKSTSNVSGGTIGISGNYNKNLLGAQLMAGVDLFLTNTCTLRLSDAVTLYPTASTTWLEPISAESFAGRFTLTTNTVMAGVYFYL